MTINHEDYIAPDSFAVDVGPIDSASVPYPACICHGRRNARYGETCNILAGTFWIAQRINILAQGVNAYVASVQCIFPLLAESQPRWEPRSKTRRTVDRTCNVAQCPDVWDVIARFAPSLQLSAGNCCPIQTSQQAIGDLDTDL